ncbi:LamG domain-containing protein [bacterium]|nr:LamG domain-containing protein [bacterium]
MGTYSALPRAQYRQQPKRMPRTLGFERYALGSNGSTNYVEVPDSASLDITNAVTVEIWVFYKGHTGNYDHIISKRNSDGSNANYELYSDGSDSFMFGAHVSGTWKATPWVTLSTNEWHHVVGTFDGSYLKFYLDGGFKEQTEASGTLDTNSNSLFIGKGGYTAQGNNFFNGLIALIRIYKDYALTPEEVKWNLLNYNNPVHPEHFVLWLPLEEGSGGTVYDKSGYGNNGTLLPADDPPTWQRVRQWELRASV